MKVTRLVDRELIDLYWEIGKYLDERIETNGWGKGTVRQLSDALLRDESGLRGLSSSNLWRMRQFYPKNGNGHRLPQAFRRTMHES